VHREPVAAGAIALAFVPGERLLDIVERLHVDGARAPDRARPIGAVEHHDMAADAAHLLAADLDVAQQVGGRAFGTVEHQRQQRVARVGAAAKAADNVVLLGHAACRAIGVPERLDLGRARLVHRTTLSENRQTDNAPMPR
jgi:hypothetical protein